MQCTSVGTSRVTAMILEHDDETTSSDPMDVCDFSTDGSVSGAAPLRQCLLDLDPASRVHATTGLRMAWTGWQKILSFLPARELIHSTAMTCSAFSTSLPLSRISVLDDLRIDNAMLCAVTSHRPPVVQIELMKLATLDNATLLHMLAHCPRVRELNIANCRLISGRSVRDIGLHCQRLKALNVSELPGLCESDIVQCCRSLPELESITLDRHQCAAVADIMQSCQHIKTISIVG